MSDNTMNPGARDPNRNSVEAMRERHTAGQEAGQRDIEARREAKDEARRRLEEQGALSGPRSFD